MSGIEYSGSPGKRSTDPNSPTGFEATDRSLRRYLERRKRILEQAKAEGVLDDLLRLEKLEEAAAAEREREAAKRARREFLTTTPRTLSERARQRLHVLDKLSALERKK